MQLKLESATGTVLQSNGPDVKQNLRITNSQHGVKALAVRLRIAYNLGDSTQTEMVEVKNLPQGL